MADFSALKQSIETYIKNNGNKEITGAILQNILLSMVTTMGDGAINDNASDISDIKGDIQNTLQPAIIAEKNRAEGAESTLQQAIIAEKNRAEGAETTTVIFSDGKLVFKNAAGTVLYQLSVDSFLSAITMRLNTGALYAGYATPSTTPAALTSQEVFYLATQAGTYTNFHFNGGDDPIVLTKDGIYFIVSGSDDDDWNAEPMLQLDDVPTAGSDNPVKSGGVAEELALGAVYDVSAKNPTAGPNSDGKWESLSALLSDANLNTLIPTSVRKGGMSIKFVQSSDNNYVQFRYKLQYENTTAGNAAFLNTNNWQGVDKKPTPKSHNLVESGNVNGVIFADGQPYIKELYINEAGQQADVATIHNVYCGNNVFYIKFSNTAKSTFTASTDCFTSKEAASGIILIRKYNNSQVYGYIVVDWNLLDSNLDPVTPLNAISYNIDYSPSIKGYLQNIRITTNTDNITKLNLKIYEGDSKDLTSISSDITNNTTFIWFQWPKQRIAHVDKIRYKTANGTINFYKVTLDETTGLASAELIASDQNESFGSIKELSVNIDLLSNQFIGINGAFYYTNDDNDYESCTVNVETGVVSSRSKQILAYEYVNNNSLDSTINELKDDIDDLDKSITNVANEMTSIDNNVTALATKLIYGDRKTLSIITGSADNTTFIWFQWPKQRIAHVDKIRYKTANGTINFYKVTLDETTGLASAELIISDTSTVAGLYVELQVDVDLLENQFIGVNGKFIFSSSIEQVQGYYANYFNVSTGVLNHEDKDSQILAFEALNYNSVEAEIEAEIESIKSEIESLSLNDIGKYSVLLNEKLTSSKDFIVEAQTYGTFGLIVDNYITINKWYALSQRTAKFLCKFASDTVAVFETVIGVSSTGVGNTYFTLNISSKTCRCRDLQTYSCDILTSGDIISVDITKEYGLQILTITNITLGKSQTFSWRFNGTGGVGAGAIGTTINTGMQWDYYRLRKASGTQFEVSQVVITAPKADMIIYGDSITNGESYWPANTLHEHWVQLIVDKMRGRAVASGRSGEGINTMFQWMQNEIPFILPKYVMITIGTNGGVTQAKLTEIVEYIQSLGCTPILNHIPANINSGGRTNHVVVNQIIDIVRSEKGIVGADFDLVTSINGVPADGVNMDMMWMEDYGGETGTVYHHPNALGSMAMFHKMLLDVPQILDV